jgi:hypothetical protein
MAGPYIAGTFATGSAPVGAGGLESDACVIHSSCSQMRLTLQGANASNSVRTQRRTTPGGAWVNQTTYTANQQQLGIVVTPGHEWRLSVIALQAGREIRYELDAL